MDATDLLFPTYRFSVPLSKAYSTVERGETQYLVEGVASDESNDQQGDVVDQLGMNIEPFLKSGYINWDHKDGPENQIGEPLHGEITPARTFFVRGNLYVDDVERAAHAWHLAHATMKSGGRRTIGWSIEGLVARRAGKRIAASEVRHVALTHQPVNQNTWVAIVKSMTSVTAAPLQLENLAGHVTNAIWGDCADGQSCYDVSGRFMGGRSGMLNHLHLCKGIPVADAKVLMQRLIDTKL